MGDLDPELLCGGQAGADRSRLDPDGEGEVGEDFRPDRRAAGPQKSRVAFAPRARCNPTSGFVIHVAAKGPASKR